MTATKFRQIGVPNRDLFSRRILKACNLGRVEARYLKPEIVFSWSTNTSPVRNSLNTIVYTQILICVMTIFSQNVSISPQELFLNNYDVGKKKKASGVTVSTIRERVEMNKK